MAAFTHDNALERAVRRVPLPVRVGVIAVWVALALYAKWQTTGDREVAPWVDIALAIGLAFLVARGAPRLLDALRAPDRAPVDLDPLLLGFLVFTGSLLVVGPWALFDDDSETSPLMGVFIFGLGLVFAALFLWYLRKPVRPDARGALGAEWVSREDDKSWRVGAGWYLPTPRASDQGRDRDPSA